MEKVKKETIRCALSVVGCAHCPPKFKSACIIVREYNKMIEHVKKLEAGTKKNFTLKETSE